MILIGTISELVCVVFWSSPYPIIGNFLNRSGDHVQFFNLASMARKIYLRGGIGVGAFRRIYGGSKRNGSRPPHFCKSSGSIARHILQQLQMMSIIELDPKGWVYVWMLCGVVMSLYALQVAGLVILLWSTSGLWKIYKSKIGALSVQILDPIQEKNPWH